MGVWVQNGHHARSGIYVNFSSFFGLLQFHRDRGVHPKFFSAKIACGPGCQHFDPRYAIFPGFLPYPIRNPGSCLPLQLDLIRVAVTLFRSALSGQNSMNCASCFSNRSHWLNLVLNCFACVDLLHHQQVCLHWVSSLAVLVTAFASLGLAAQVHTCFM